jgi:hypothetical protein
VERALTLVATGTLTIAMARASKGKTVTLPRTLNHSTGKESMRQTGFSDTAWGKATRGYAKSARSLANTKFEAIVKDAQKFMKPIRARNKDPTEVINIDDDDDDDDERACLVDNSGSDTECMSFSSSMISLTQSLESTSGCGCIYYFLAKSPSRSHLVICYCLLPCQIQLWLIMLVPHFL